MGAEVRLLACVPRALHLTLPSPAPRAKLVDQALIRLLQAIQDARDAQQTALGAEVRVLAPAMRATELQIMVSRAQLVRKESISLKVAMRHALRVMLIA